ncbi:uncharacterized protein RCC_01984 [Ramularia collo-cygni]|uniref:Uncharacterized protein n=1 Tax=Ramularia collo-cygni TaxID=112498 RepID=A0A2D3V721_9PEZI|nr:uncharacterized protein RCC_01984 [Ramularia collo-cygni]CZT16143.1 uncharacterized protein RCC_01984 [Ramularia collo-cygni]
MSDITEWELRAKRSPSWSQPADQQIVDLLISMFHEEIRPSYAAKAMHRIQGVGFRWLIVCDAIRRLGGSLKISELLVDLLNALARLSIEDTQDLQEQDKASPKKPELPQSWHVTFREYGLFLVHYDEAIDNKDEFYGQGAKLLNASTFAATLMLQAEFDNDMHLYAFEAMDTALVAGYDPDYLGQEWRVMLPSAAAWVFIAAPKMHEICQNGLQDYKPSPEKWTLWKQKLMGLASSSDLDNNCKSLSARAARLMEEVENS